MEGSRRWAPAVQKHKRPGAGQGLARMGDLEERARVGQVVLPGVGWNPSPYSSLTLQFYFLKAFICVL